MEVIEVVDYFDPSVETPANMIGAIQDCTSSGACTDFTDPI